MTFSFLADEHVKRVFVTELRANGYDVTWVDEDYEAGTPDREHLRRSSDSNRVILSNDVDFTENQGESLALQGGDESDTTPHQPHAMARQDIPRCVIHTFK